MILRLIILQFPLLNRCQNCHQQQNQLQTIISAFFPYTSPIHILSRIWKHSSIIITSTNHTKSNIQNQKFVFYTPLKTPISMQHVIITIYLHKKKPTLTPTTITQPKFPPPSHLLAQKRINYLSQAEEMIQHPQKLANMDIWIFSTVRGIW